MTPPQFDSEGHIARVREDLPSLAGVTYLNSGTTGPMPVPVAEAVCEAAMAHVHRPRTGREYFDQAIAVRQSCFSRMA